MIQTEINQNIVLKCVLKIIDDTEEEENTNNNNINHYERLLRFLDELFCNSHFPSLSFQTNTTNKFTLIAISYIING